MDTLFQKLKSIYKENPMLELLYPFDETYLLIRRFLIENIKQNNTYLEAEEYANTYAKDYYETFNLFFSLSGEEGIFNKLYLITCSECGELTITSSLTEDYECSVCGEQLDLEEDYTNIFTNINYSFEIQSSIIKDIKSNLKVLPSSPSKLGGEGPEEISATVNNVLNAPDNKSLPEIENEKQIIEQFRRVMMNND